MNQAFFPVVAGNLKILLVKEKAVHYYIVAQ
jgi:hypothetical protein